MDRGSVFRSLYLHFFKFNLILNNYNFLLDFKIDIFNR